MNNPLLGMIVLIGLTILMSVVVFIVAAVRYRDGYEAGGLDERSTRHERQLAARAEEADFEAWLTEMRRPLLPGEDAFERLAVTGEIPALAPVASTSELRALTDEFIAAMQADEEDYRKGMTA